MAQTSLKERLRDGYTVATSDQLENFHRDPFWIQLLGVSEALTQLHSFEVPDDHREGILFGYHFDLKPANILITTEGTFVISDFGQAYFRRSTDATTSKVVGMGGAETYAPPEIDDPNAKLNRKYDVWSLGCIFLEVIWYLMKGSAGVYELEDCRLTRSSYRQEERYFAKDERGKYGVKAIIVEKTKSLMELLEAKPARGFLRFIIGLTLQMLDSDVRSRLSASEVSEELRSGLDKAREGKLMHEDSAVLLAKHVEGDRNALLTDLSHLTDLKYMRASNWRQDVLGLVEQRQTLTLVYYEDGESHSILLGDRSKLQLIPSYAMNQEAQFATSSAVVSLRLVDGSMNNEVSTETYHYDFQSRYLTDILTLQGLLLQRDILGHWTLTSARFEKAFGKLSALTRRPKSDPSPEKASALQLWTDSSIESRLSRGTVSTAQRPRQASSKPVMRRLLIYSPETICVFQVGRDFRISEKQPWDEDSPFVNLVPDQRQDHPEFTGRVFQYFSKPAITGLALSKANLESYESKNRTKYESIVLQVSAVSEAIAFRKRFRKERKAWFSECDAYEKEKPNRTRSLGYEVM